MNKTSWIIIASVLIAIGVVAFLFNNFFIISGWKVVSRLDYDIAELNEVLIQGAKLGEPNKQIQAAEKLIKLRKNDNKAKLDLAGAYLDKASLEFKEEEYAPKAIQLAEEVLADEPDNYEAYLTIGYAYEVLQDYSKSLENYNKAIELSSNSDIVYTKRGHAYDLSGDLVSAEKDYLKAYEINDKSDIALMNLARISQIKGDSAKASYYASLILPISDIAYVRSAAYSILGLVHLSTAEKYSSSKDFTNARAEYRLATEKFTEAIKIYENNSNYYANRAYSQILSVGYDVSDNNLKIDIENDIKKSIEIHSASSFSYVVYGLFMESTGNDSKALEYYEKALKMVDDDITKGVAEKEPLKDKIKILIDDVKQDLI